MFTWTNLNGDSAQHGHVFVWSWQDRPEAIGTVFSVPTNDGQRKLIHEFHTLSMNQLFPVAPESSEYQWTPQQGIALAPLQHAPPPARTSAARLLQMRTLARSIAVETINPEGERFHLRLLPTPLVRYQPQGQQVVDGALFALVMSVGTDPEAILMIESRRTGAASQPIWHAAVVRFSDRDVTVRHGEELLWSSVDDPSLKVTVKHDWRLLETPDRTYMCYQSRVIPELPSAAD